MQEQEYELDTRSNRGQTTVGVSCGYLVLWTRAGMQGGRLVAGALDRMPLDQDTMQTRTLTVWTPRVGTTATKALELPCHYRRGRLLPDLRPWQHEPHSMRGLILDLAT